MVLRLMSCSPRRPAIGFTHLETRLKNRDLDDRRFWKRLYYGPSANVDKTRVFRTGRPLMKRCVHEIAGDRAFLPPPPREYGFVMPGRANKTSARLDASVGASGPHDFAVRNSISRQRAGYRSQVSSTRPAIHRALNAAASTATHPAFRDGHDTPLLWGGMGRICRDDLPDG
jgi:hypothetical protein